jgi:hypothetical protein
MMQVALQHCSVSQQAASQQAAASHAWVGWASGWLCVYMRVACVYEGCVPVHAPFHCTAAGGLRGMSYRGVPFHMVFNFPDSYPAAPPRVQLCTRIAL